MEPLQGTESWLNDRLGHCTASRMGDVLTVIKHGEAAARRNYRMQLVCERLTGRVLPTFQSQAMLEGTENEPIARMEYEVLTGGWVEKVGFVRHPSIKWFGASPDGLVDEEGLVEIKCPLTSTHVEYLLNNKVPEDYKPQMLAQLACTKRRWVDFISFDPRLDGNNRLFVVRFEPPREEIEKVEEAARFFIKTVDEMVEVLKRRAA